MKCPCENCICISVCRHKEYIELFQDCKIINDFELFYDEVEKRASEKIQLLENILQPSEWFIRFSDDDLIWICSTKYGDKKE